MHQFQLRISITSRSCCKHNQAPRRPKPSRASLSGAHHLRANLARRSSNLAYHHPSRRPPLSESRLHFFPTCDMGDHSASTHVQTLFGSALRAYEAKTGVTLSEHPLVVQLQDCHTVESIISLLRGQAKDFSDSRLNGRLTNVIESIVSILSTLSATSVLGESTGLVRQDASIAHSPSDRFTGIPTHEINTSWSCCPTCGM